MYLIIYTYHVKPKIPTSSQETFARKVIALWPALKGSLALVRKPCIRPGCRACAQGEKHPNYLLTFTHQRRRRCLYVPKAMVSVLKRALQKEPMHEGADVETGLRPPGFIVGFEHYPLSSTVDTFLDK